MLSVVSETVSTVRGHHQARNGTGASDQPNGGFASLVDNNLAATDQPTPAPAKPATNNAAPTSPPPATFASKNDDADNNKTAAVADVSDQNKTPSVDSIVAATAQAVAPSMSTAPAVATDSLEAADDATKPADADSPATGDVVATPAVTVAAPQTPVATVIANPTAPLPSPAVTAPPQDIKPTVDEIGATPVATTVPQPADVKAPAVQASTVAPATSDVAATVPATQMPSQTDAAQQTTASTPQQTQPQPQAFALQTAPLTDAAAGEPALAATVVAKADLPVADNASNRDQPKAATKAAATAAAPATATPSVAQTSANDKLPASDDSSTAATGTVADNTAPTTSDQPKTTETQARPEAADKSAQTAKKDAEPGTPVTQDRSPHAATTTIVTHNLLTGGTAMLQTATTLHATGAMAADANQSATTLNVSVANTAAVPLGALGVEIASNLQGGRSRFEIRLDPAELGRIDVRLDIDKNGQVTSHLAVEKPATLDMLRREAPQLERALSDAGFKTSGDGLRFSLRDQSSSGRNDDDGSRQKSQRLTISEDENALRESVGRNYGRLSGISGGLDIRV